MPDFAFLGRLKAFPWIFLLNLCLAAFAAYHLMQGWLQIQRPLAQTQKQHITSTSSVQPGIAKLDIQPLLQNSLLGQRLSTSSRQIQSQALQKIPETKLALTLQGTLFSDDKEQAIAVVSVPKSKGKEYQIGATLPGGVKLHDIQVDRVILQRNQTYETLKLIRKKNSSAKLQYSAAPMPTNKPISVLENKLAKQRQQILENPASIGHYIRIQPLRQHGKFMGYRIHPGKQPALFTEAGLKSGDIVTQLNAVKLDSPLKGLQVLQQLAANQTVDIEVLRNGRVMAFNFRLAP
ncbi:type II secretion system protein GspC [Candidatus Venteria ishoeyi]|uniref:type II secretion system protein GspC n=1 Tax=Candidatus Venteria ishoeyi TaxID=1899563 RepID=UPI0025A537F1|nr:type II secretion system protein GspC [Candidatus Venteria ishoeyi]MDM8546286.1 type II secretion system protein GspC [Candidatus Venteria ishoeyi]